LSQASALRPSPQATASGAQPRGPGYSSPARAPPASPLRATPQRDIEVNVSGGYDPTTTSPDARLVRTAAEVYRRSGIDPILWPRRGGSWPGYVFTGDPLKLPAGHFGLGHGQGAHAPDEYFLVESSDPKVAGIDGAVKSYVDYLFALA
jgi:di/tripeptidase